MSAKSRATSVIVCALLILSGCGQQAETPKAPSAKAEAAATAAPKAPTVEALEAAVPENPLKEAYFGETHVHTSYSLDAYIGGARITPDEAYRFAKGEDVTVNGSEHNIGRPLDFVAVSDHAEFIGEMYSTQVRRAKGHDNPMLDELRGLKDVEEQRAVVREVRHQQHARGDNPSHPPFYAGPGDDEVAPGRTSIVKAAQRPLPAGAASRRWSGYEWTAAPNAGNMHRNVLFRDLNVPEMPLSARSTPTTRRSSGRGWPSRRSRARGCSRSRTTRTAARAMMFKAVDSAGKPLTAEYARDRAKSLRAPDRDDADQGQLGGAPQVLAGRRVRELRERRQRGRRSAAARSRRRTSSAGR